MTPRARPSYRILYFLSESFNVLLQAVENKRGVESCIEALYDLESKATQALNICGASVCAFPDGTTDVADRIKLYRTAAMIYILRASESISHQFRNVQPLLDEAFSLLSQIATCELQFPLLVMGLEARTDEQRAIMLDLATRTEQKAHRKKHCFRLTLKSWWAQEDLLADQDFVPNYMDRLSAVISRTTFMPSFA